MPTQCVRDDKEFSQSRLELKSRTAIRRIIERHAPAAKGFFTDILQLSNAGVKELLADLALMQEKKSSNQDRAYRLYERIQSYRYTCETIIKYVSMPQV